MESQWMIDKQKVLDELIGVQEFAEKLRFLVENKSCGDGNMFCSSKDKECVAKVLQTFSNTLSILKNSGDSDVCQSPMSNNNQVESPCSDDRKSENSGEKKKKNPVTKDRRGGYKRRKVAETWTEITEAPKEDGFSWRKYGQKEILNTKFPRNYFRCTHKTDKGCQANKQVQRIEEDPPKYRTIYIGHHTCRNTLKAPHLIIDSSPTHSFLLNFQSNTTTATTTNPYGNNTILSTIKQEQQDEVPNELPHDRASTSDYFVSTDLSTFEASRTASIFASGSDLGDVISCTSSSRSLELDNIDDYMVSVNFVDDMFNFDGEFLSY